MLLQFFFVLFLYDVYNIYLVQRSTFFALLFSNSFGFRNDGPQIVRISFFFFVVQDTYYCCRSWDCPSGTDNITGDHGIINRTYGIDKHLYIYMWFYLLCSSVIAPFLFPSMIRFGHTISTGLVKRGRSLTHEKKKGCISLPEHALRTGSPQRFYLQQAVDATTAPAGGRLVE